MGDLLEISDLIVDYDVETLERRPVRRDEVVERLRANGQRRAARYVATLPATDGVLDAEACDGVLLRAHVELQRLNEEFLQAERVRRVLLPLLDAMRAHGVPTPYRVVDVGCGIGYVIRALAAHGRLGRDVELIGCDMNVALVRAAQALAEKEHLSCELRVANAFTLAEPAHVFISTGVVHHFRGDGLRAFFKGQASAWGFVHHDIQPSVLSPVGSWVFHQARMREPLAQHDGVVSAARVHSAQALLEAARAETALECRAFDQARSFLSVAVRPMHAVLGARREVFAEWVTRLGPLASRLGAAS